MAAGATVSGPLLFARYAAPPNRLGYCGPEGGPDLALLAGDPAVLARWAREFDGCRPYLRLLAAAAGLDDPLDARVVEAYWVGNDLLDRVDPAELAACVRTAFDGQTRGRWRTLAAADGAATALAHHSFHVLEVYPWVALLGRGPTALGVLDRCRIRWGRVLDVGPEHVLVRSRPLRLAAGTLALGETVDERARWGGPAWLPGVEPGVWVSLHWDWVCDVLTDAARAELEARSAAQLDATNRWLTGSCPA